MGARGLQRNLCDKKFRVVSIDMPGHGLTGAVPNGDYSQEGMVRFVKEVADKLGLDKFAIAGNSMGGGVAARFAEEYPDRITHLILVDAGGMNTKFGDHVPLAFRLARVPVVNQMMLYVTPRSIVTEGLNDAIVHKEIITSAMIDSYWDLARMQGTRAATLERFQLPMPTEIPRDIGKIKAPTLVLWGEEDHLIPVEAAHMYANDIHGAKLVIYPHTGHLPQEEVADQSAAAVTAKFLCGFQRGQVLQEVLQWGNDARATLVGRNLMQVGLTCRDLDRAQHFYRDVLGLPLLFEVSGMLFFQLGISAL